LGILNKTEGEEKSYGLNRSTSVIYVT